MLTEDNKDLFSNDKDSEFTKVYRFIYIIFAYCNYFRLI